MRVFKACLVFLLLLKVKILSRLFYRTEVEWIGEVRDEPWRNVRLIVLLNHTSLFEPLFLSVFPLRMMWRFAVHGMAPAAAKTMDRPFVGLFYSLAGQNVIPISRERDETWQRVIDAVEPKTLVIMAAEGRMKRADGLDLTGRPLTVRGGAADILEILGTGRLVVAYSGGLHHVQSPGQWRPRLFRTIRLKLEGLDIAGYLDGLRSEPGEAPLKVRVIRDLERRRDLVCPPMERASGVDYGSGKHPDR